MEEIETKEQNLIQHIRTAGLHKRREIALVDEVLDLIKEKRKLLTSHQMQIATLTSENAGLTSNCSTVIADAKEQLCVIKAHYEDKYKNLQTQYFNQNKDLLEENKSLLDQNNALKAAQQEITAKYTEKMSTLDGKIKELGKFQQAVETTLRQEVEAALEKKLRGDLELKHEKEITK